MNPLARCTITDQPPPITAAILLAAGLSTRMGEPKPLLPWDGRTLVQFQVAQLRDSGADDVVVVTGHEAGAVAQVLSHSGARAVHNPEYAAGRAGSVRVGARAVRDDASTVVLLNVDQPRPAELIRTLLDAHRRAGALISVPAVAGRRGHPVILDGSLLGELRSVTEEGEGLRAIMRAHAARVHEVTVTDERALLDLNTRDDYRAGLRAFGATGRAPSRRQEI